MADQQIPDSLNPVDMSVYPASAGGAEDVQSTVNGLQTQLAENPPTPYPEQQYNYYKNFFKQNQPGMPDYEIERMALEHAQKDVDTKAAQAAKVQSQQQLQQSHIDAQNEMRAKLGLLPLPGGTPQNSAPESGVDASQFAVPQQAQAPQSVTGTPDLIKSAQGLAGTYTKQQKANEAIANAAAHKASLDEIAHAEAEDQFKQQALRQQKLQADFDTAFKQRTMEMENISKQLASQDFTAGKVDSNRLWSNMGTGQKVLAGIALALGAVGGGVTGKSNMAMDVINKAIDRDIEEQKFNIQQDMQGKQLKSQNLRDQMSVQSSLLSNLRAKFGDDLQSEAALRAIMIDRIQQQLAKYSSNMEGSVVQQNATVLNQQLEREKIVAMQQMKAQLAQQKILEQMGTQGAGNLTPMQMAALPKEIREQLEKQQETSAAPGSEWIGQAPNKELLNKFVEKANEVQPAIDGAQRILAATKELNRVTDVKKKAEIATELKALAGSLRVPFTGPGALTQKEYERLMDTLGDPTSIMSMPSVQRAKLITVLNKLNSDLETAAKNTGLRRRPKVNVPMKPY